MDKGYESHKQEKNIVTCNKTPFFMTDSNLIYIRTNNPLVISRYDLTNDCYVLGLTTTKDSIKTLMPNFAFTPKFGELKTPISASENLTKKEFEGLYEKINCVGGLIKIIKSLETGETNISNIDLKDCKNCPL